MGQHDHNFGETILVLVGTRAELVVTDRASGKREVELVVTERVFDQSEAVRVNTVAMSVKIIPLSMRRADLRSRISPR